MAGKPFDLRFPLWHRNAMTSMAGALLALVGAYVYGTITIGQNLEQRFQKESEHLAQQWYSDQVHELEYWTDRTRHECPEPILQALRARTQGTHENLKFEEIRDLMSKNSLAKGRRVRFLMLLDSEGRALFNSTIHYKKEYAFGAKPEIKKALNPYARPQLHWWSSTGQAKSYLSSQFDESPLRVMTIPIRDQDQKLIGVFVVGEELKLDRYLPKPPRDHEILIKSQNKTLTSSFEDWEVRKTLKSETESLKASKEKSSIKVKNHRYRYMVFAPPSEEVNECSLVIFSDIQSHAQRLNEETLLLLGQIALILFPLCGILGWLSSRWTSKRLKVLSAAHLEVGRGDFDQVLPEGGGDEVSIATESFNRMSSGLKQGEFIEHSLKRFVSGDIVGKYSTERKGEQADLSAVEMLSHYCSEVIDFSDICDQTEPSELVKWMNHYFTEVSGRITQNDGYVDRFEGSTIKAHFNAPIRNDDHVLKAVESALQHLKIVEENLADEWELHYNIRPRVAIGLHFGNSHVANIGIENRLHYTSFGLNVDAASHLMESCRMYGTKILASEYVVRELPSSIVRRPIDRLILVGPHPITVYEIIGDKEEVDASRILQCEDFESMTRHFWRRDFLEALRICEVMSIEDQAVRLFKQRCRYYIEHPPPENWDGVW